MKKIKLAFLLIITCFITSLSYGQTGIGTKTPHASSMVDISATNKGLLIPRVSLQSITDQTTTGTPATSLMVYNTNVSVSLGLEAGYYYWNGSKWVKLIYGTQTPTVQAGNPLFFYSPSILIPLAPTGTAQTLDLYATYKTQFQTAIKSGGNLPVYDKTQLDYFVLYYDTDLFSAVSINANGVLTYTVNSGVSPSAASFMNVAFKLKD